ncbi:metallophosphoesterase [Xanthomonas phage JGB6]|nr:metallophosphoesterase [Xanthomonas phage JGB6]
MSYRVEKDKATKLFQDYRKGVDEITAVDLRNIIQNTFVNVAGNRKIETVYGAGKKDLIDEVKVRSRHVWHRRV